MQHNIDQPGKTDADKAVLEPLRTDRTMSGGESEVEAHGPATAEEPTIIGPDKARGATNNRMPARVLLISVSLTAAAFIIGYLLVR